MRRILVIYDLDMNMKKEDSLKYTVAYDDTPDGVLVVTENIKQRLEYNMKERNPQWVGFKYGN